MAENIEAPQVENLPTHIAIIMDGNGRWAAARNKPRMAGHRAGTENLRRIIKACVRFGIKYLTIYAFSTENWKRPQDEVSGLMQIMGDVLEKEVPELHEQGVQLRHIGRLEQLDKNTQAKIRKAIELTRGNQRLVVNVAWNYGGRDEIVYAVQQIIAADIHPEDITQEVISDHLFTKGSPDPDLVIRTSGEMRTSNFLIWQSAYSEWYFTDILWPDFNEAALKAAIEDFDSRERRFGGRKPADAKEKYAG
jgi:undecaprenyl diphosphate synthase